MLMYQFIYKELPMLMLVNPVGLPHSSRDWFRFSEEVRLMYIQLLPVMVLSERVGEMNVNV